jgi:hypothetical protein
LELAWRLDKLTAVLLAVVGAMLSVLLQVTREVSSTAVHTPLLKGPDDEITVPKGGALLYVMVVSLQVLVTLCTSYPTVDALLA